MPFVIAPLSSAAGTAVRTGSPDRPTGANEFRGRRSRASGPRTRGASDFCHTSCHGTAQRGTQFSVMGACAPELPSPPLFHPEGNPMTGPHAVPHDSAAVTPTDPRRPGIARARAPRVRADDRAQLRSRRARSSRCPEHSHWWSAAGPAVTAAHHQLAARRTRGRGRAHCVVPPCDRVAHLAHHRVVRPQLGAPVVNAGTSTSRDDVIDRLAALTGTEPSGITERQRQRRASRCARPFRSTSRRSPRFGQGAAGDVLGVAVGQLAQLCGSAWKRRLELLPRLLALGRDVLGRPVALVRAVALEHVAGDGRLVHLVDAVGDAHRRRARRTSPAAA